MNTEFKRESISRHQSERLLDRNLITYERKQPIQQFERAIEKKIKKDEEEKKVNQEIIAKMKSEDIKPQDALERIVKAFDNPKKCSKAIAIYKDLLSKNFDSLEPDHVFYSLYLLMKNFPNMSSADDKKTINAIFQFFETKKDQILRTAEFKASYKIWCYEGLVHPQVFTDDSYQLNGAIKKTKELIDDLNKPEDEIEEDKPAPQPKPAQTETAPKTDISLIRQKLMKKKEEPAPEAKPEPVAETVQPVVPKYEFTIPQECLDEIKSQEGRREMRRKILFETTKDIYVLYKHTWAKPIVKQYFDQIYLEREVFNEEQKKVIEELKAGLSSLKGLDTVKGFKRDTLDSKIMANPLASGNDVKDARSTSFSFDSIGKWAGRQSGM